MMDNQEQASARTFLCLTLCAAAGFALEAVLMGLERLIPAWGDPKWNIAIIGLHWVLNAAIWGVLCVKLGGWARKKTGFYWLRETVQPGERRFLGALLCTAAVVGLSAWTWGGFKPSVELEQWNWMGSLNWLAFCVQAVYLLFKARLMMLLICFGQQLGESLGGKPFIPWGGVVLALSWGVLHVLTHGMSTALYAAGSALLYGGIYLFALQNAKLAYPLIALALIL